MLIRFVSTTKVIRGWASEFVSRAAYALRSAVTSFISTSPNWPSETPSRKKMMRLGFMPLLLL